MTAQEAITAIKSIHYADLTLIPEIRDHGHDLAVTCSVMLTSEQSPTVTRMRCRSGLLRWYDQIELARLSDEDALRAWVDLLVHKTIQIHDPNLPETFQYVD